VGSSNRRPKDGRPTLLTDEVAAAIVRHVADGCPVSVAATAAGVGVRTVRRWLARGRAGGPGTGPYMALLAALQKARAECAAASVAHILQAGEPHEQVATRTVRRGDAVVTTTTARTARDWTALAWHLERTYPEEFGRDLRRMVERGNLSAARQNPTTTTPE
jgi:hypothetical protein